MAPPSRPHVSRAARGSHVRTDARALHARNASVARRLLGGAGSASFVAYRHDAHSDIDVLAHGLTTDGRLVVATVDDVEHLRAQGASDIRLDLRREATEARVRILAATAHLLGTLEVLSDDARTDQLVARLFPQDVALVASAPTATVGIVHTDRVLLHDAGGVTPMAMADLLGDTDSGRRGARGDTAFPSAAQELEAQEVFGALPHHLVEALCDAVIDGSRPGWVMSSKPASPGCSHSIGRVYCVDVDATGVTLMKVGAQETTVVFTAFAEQAHDVASLGLRVAGLLPMTRD